MPFFIFLWLYHIAIVVALYRGYHGYSHKIFAQIIFGLKLFSNKTSGKIVLRELPLCMRTYLFKVIGPRYAPLDVATVTMTVLFTQILLH